VRDPRGWYASARSHKQRFGDLDTALALWLRGTEEIKAAKRELPDRVFILTYEALVTETERAMRALAAWLGIDWTPSLLEPSFNRRPIPPNSSFDMPAGGVRTESLERWRVELDHTERSLIEERALPAYRVLSKMA
jgi:hypothetical protein